MNMVILITAGIILVTVIAICNIYNTLIKKKNKVLEALSGVDVQLKKRYDLLPNLVNIASGYLKYEKEILEKIVLLRKQSLSSVNLNKKFELNEEISQILATFENYPELKADETMANLMRSNCEIEEHISAARRFYNSAVNDLNNTIEVFPNSIFAKIFNINTKVFYSANQNEKINNNINFKK